MVFIHFLTFHKKIINSNINTGRLAVASLRVCRRCSCTPRNGPFDENGPLKVYTLEKNECPALRNGPLRVLHSCTSRKKSWRRHCRLVIIFIQFDLGISSMILSSQYGRKANKKIFIFRVKRYILVKIFNLLRLRRLPRVLFVKKYNIFRTSTVCGALYSLFRKIILARQVSPHHLICKLKKCERERDRFQALTLSTTSPPPRQSLLNRNFHRALEGVRNERALMFWNGRKIFKKESSKNFLPTIGTAEKYYQNSGKKLFRFPRVHFF